MEREKLINNCKMEFSDCATMEREKLINNCKMGFNSMLVNDEQSLSTLDSYATMEREKLINNCKNSADETRTICKERQERREHTRTRKGHMYTLLYVLVIV
jgi:DNA repair ATPase RecN